MYGPLTVDPLMPAELSPPLVSFNRTFAPVSSPLRGSALVDAIVQLRAVARAYPERRAEVAALIEAIILGESAR